MNTSLEGKNLGKEASQEGKSAQAQCKQGAPAEAQQNPSTLVVYTAMYTV